MRRITTLLTLLFLVFSPLKLLASPPQEEHQLAASIEVLNPGVELMRKDTEQWLVITGKAVVAAGDRIRTDAEGEALITWFADGTVMQIQPTTEIIIDKFSADTETFTINATVTFGQVINSVQRIVNDQSEYRLNTSSLHAVVRGTVFAINVSEQQETIIVVVEGTVIATQNEREVSVGENEWIEATLTGAISAPASIEQSENEVVSQIFDDSTEDRDEDDVIDLADACPDESGSVDDDGCPSGDDHEDDNGDDDNGEDGEADDPPDEEDEGDNGDDGEADDPPDEEDEGDDPDDNPEEDDDPEEEE